LLVKVTFWSANWYDNSSLNGHMSDVNDGIDPIQRRQFYRTKINITLQGRWTIYISQLDYKAMIYITF